MRIFEFRGKTRGGKWKYGNSLLFLDTSQVYIDGAEVDFHTIGQGIGIKDDNGNEIYEGDVVRLWQDDWLEEEYEKGPVKYFGNQYYPAFDVETDKDLVECNVISFFKNEGHIEVIGNIFEGEEGAAQ